MGKLYKNFWFDLCSATAALIIGIVMIPTFGISGNVLDILLAITLVAYLVIFLFDKLKRTKGAIFVLTIIEFVLISVLAIGLVFQQFKLISISSVCQSIGLVLWLRGVVMAVGMYLASLAAKKPQSNLPRFILSIVLISVGALLFASPIIADNILEWVLCISFFIYAVIFLLLAFLFAPWRDKKPENK